MPICTRPQRRRSCILKKTCYSREPWPTTACLLRLLECHDTMHLCRVEFGLTMLVQACAVRLYLTLLPSWQQHLQPPPQCIAGP
jgi:hypothetical protein